MLGAMDLEKTQAELSWYGTMERTSQLRSAKTSPSALFIAHSSRYLIPST
jgi:hypothetical protein